MATISELQARLREVEAERDELAKKLQGIQEQFGAVKRAYLSSRSKGAPDPRVAELEAELARVKIEAANERAKLSGEIEKLKGIAGPSPTPAPPSKQKPAAPDPKAILQRLAEEEGN